MNSYNAGFFYRKEILNGVIYTLGVLLLLLLSIQPGTAIVTANFTAENQAGMPLPIDYNAKTGLFSCGDYFILSDNSTVTGLDSILFWNWTVTGYSPRYIYPPNNPNQIFGVFTSGPVTVTLNVTNSTGVPSEQSIVFNTYGCGLINANFSVVPAYDNRTLEPNGTITFWDESYSKFDPELDIAYWWWTGVNLLTGQSVTSNSDHLTMPLPATTNVLYQINLTVGDTSGLNFTSISENVAVPPDNLIPIANFDVVPMSGVGPLNVSVIDQSYSMVNYSASNISLAYNYTVYNSSNSKILSSNIQNPVFLLPVNDTYSITSNITNRYGVSNETTVGNIIVSFPDGPIANFSATIREGLAPFNLTLIDQSISAIDPRIDDKNLTYFWEVGNSSGYYEVSADHNPQFPLTWPGPYWVNLTITDLYSGESDFISKPGYINVGPVKYPLAAFTAVPLNGSYPLNVSFIDQSVLDPDLIANLDEPSYTWTFDDGSVANVQNPSHVFTSAGDFTVRMNITHGGIESSATQTIYVTEPSDTGINFTWVQEYGKTAYSVVLIPLGINSDWKTNWSVQKDGIAYSPVDGSSGFTPRYDLPETGLYTVAFNASKDGFLSRDISQILEVFPNVPPSPDMTMENLNAPFKVGNNSAFGYVGQPIQFWSNKSNSMEDSWLWDFGDNSSSPLRSPLHTFSAPGLYTVTLKASNVKGETSADISDELYPYYPYLIHDTYNVWILNSIDVSPTANPNFGIAPLNVQFDAQVSVNRKSDVESRDYINRWYWDFGYGQGSAVEERPSYTYHEPGTYNPVAWVQMINDFSSWHGWTVDTITVSPTTAIDPGFTYEEIDRNGTYGYSYKFMDTSRGYYGGIVDWSWDFGDGTPFSLEPAPTHLFKEPGVYIVTLTVKDSITPVANIAKFSKTISVTQNIQSSPYAAFDTDVLTGPAPLTVQFSDQSRGNIKQWNWDFGDGQISHAQNPKHHYLLPGVFDVSLEVIDSEGNNGKVLSPGYIVAM